MKKVIVLVLLLAGMFGKTVQATENDKITKQAKAAFDKRFPDARTVVWHHLEDNNLYKVVFVYDNRELTGFISEEGQLVGIARNVTKEALPFMVNEAVSKRYPHCTISFVEEFVAESNVSYLFTLKNEKYCIYTRVYSSGDIRVIQKQKIKK